MVFDEMIERSMLIREGYRQLEQQVHGQEWRVEEDALAFLTDAGLVGRLTMAEQGRWPIGTGDQPELAHKLGECIWWVIVLAGRMNIDIRDAMEAFLSGTEKQLK